MKPEDIKKRAGKLWRRAGEIGRKSGELGQKAAAWFQEHKKETVAGCSVVMVGLAAVFLLTPKGDSKGTETEMSVATPTEAVAVETEANRIPVLDEDQKEILDGLVEMLEKKDFEAGGELLLDNEQKLQYLFYQTLRGEQYQYRDGELFEELDGVGLVLKKPMGVFYGEFQDGVPEGEGAALQGIVLDGLRYDYSYGMWSDGMMNGEGMVGYHYYEGIEGGESQAVERTGVFADDLMDGEFQYQTVSVEGEVTVWDMKADKGVTVVDDTWGHDEEKKFYYLASEVNSNHTYVLPEDAVTEPRWRNMLPWVE